MACVFCEIIAGTAPAARVYEDDRCLAFMDIHPLGDGHVLVVPRAHAYQITELEDDLARHLFGVARRVLQAQRSIGLGVEGSHLLLNDGKAANQHVPHVHVHVVPRRRRDGLRSLGRVALHVSGLMGRSPGMAKLEAQAERLRQAMGQHSG